MVMMQRLQCSLTLLLLLLAGSHVMNAFQLVHSSNKLSLCSSSARKQTPFSRVPHQHRRRRHLPQQIIRHRGVLSASSVSSESANESFLQRFQTFVGTKFFLLGMIAAVSLARAFPQLGKTGGVLRPELFIGNWGVTCIFLLSGLSLELSELKEAISNYKLNALVQFVTFGAWPFLVGLPLTQALRTFAPNLFPPALLDGLLILTCLPTTVNMCIFLTSAAGGNVASALCNAVISNLAGVFLTPALLLRFFGTDIQLPFVDMVAKLCNKVLFPVGVGQALRTTPMKQVYKTHSKKFKTLQEVRIQFAWMLCQSMYPVTYMFAVSICASSFCWELCGMHFAMPSRKDLVWK